MPGATVENRGASPAAVMVAAPRVARTRARTPRKIARRGVAGLVFSAPHGVQADGDEIGRRRTGEGRVATQDEKTEEAEECREGEPCSHEVFYMVAQPNPDEEERQSPSDTSTDLAKGKLGPCRGLCLYEGY